MNITKYLTIDTRFYTDQYHFPFSEYYVELPYRIHNIKSFTIVSIEIPMSFYNICDALNNNSIKICNVTNKNECPKTIKIPDNNYTLDTLRKQIDESLKTNGINDLYVDMSNNNFKLSSKIHDYIIELENQQYYDSKKNYKLSSLLGLRSSKLYVIPEEDKTPKQSSEKKSQEEESPQGSPETICNLFNPRYLYLEIIEYDHDKHHHQHDNQEHNHNHNNHLFSSSLLGSHISKHIIARIVLDYRTFPFGTTLPANLFNGFLISNIRHYVSPVKLKHLKIRLLNEFGFPICMNGFEISFCCQIECTE